jgi:ubiquinone/menaquinone biosynthesis C-methylase UbiE
MTDWSEVTSRVVLEAVDAHPEDRVLELGCGAGELARALASRVLEVVAVDSDAARLAKAREGAPANVRFVQDNLLNLAKFWPLKTSVVLLHDVLRLLEPSEQRALFMQLGRLLPERGLVVVGDIVWSMPYDLIDEPEQYGENQHWAPTAAALESMARSAGFLPDLHRFGVGRAVLIALKGPK